MIATKIQIKSDYVESKNDALQRQNASLQNTITELRNCGFSDIREKEIVKYEKSVNGILNTLPLTNGEKSFIRQQNCFAENENLSLDVQCLIWALINVRQNLLDVFGELITDKFFSENINFEKSQMFLLVQKLTNVSKK